MTFVWDEQKNAINKRKHGLSFEVAIYIFNDNNRLEIYDEEHSKFEERYNTIGLVEDVIFVVYTERRNYIRIISARIATNDERRLYYEQNGYNNVIKGPTTHRKTKKRNKRSRQTTNRF